MNNITPVDRALLESIVAEMEEAWNVGDARGFAAHCTPDADQINIFGTLLKGREEIVNRHDRVFKTIFQGSRNTLRLIGSSYVTADVILARLHSTIDVPHGPLQGKLETIASLLFRKTNVTCELMTFHNTRIGPDPTSTYTGTAA